MAVKTVQVNRAPVLTLWATVVAERLGFDPQAALTLGKAVAGLNAQSKGQRLGIYEPGEEKEAKPRPEAAGEQSRVDIIGRAVPVVQTEAGVRATQSGRPISPESVERYLEKKFGADLPAVREAMVTLAQALDEDQLARRAYDLYEEFRPDIPAGKRGWGAEGDLDLERIRSLAQQR